MPRFNVGETVFLVLRTSDWDTGVLTDPSNSPVSQVTDPNGTVVAGGAMTRSVTGVYFLAIPTTDFVYGKYRVKYTITDGIDAVITIHYDEFLLGR